MGSASSKIMGSSSPTESAAETVPPESADPRTTNSKSKIHFDSGYLKTHPALLKISESVLCLIGLICVQTIHSATQHSSGGWYYFVSMTGFWIALFFLASYTFHVVERLRRLPWLAAEMGYAAIWSFFFFIAACVSAIQGKNDPAWVAAATIGFVAMCIYGYEAFYKREKWHRGDVPQGERQETIAG